MLAGLLSIYRCQNATWGWVLDATMPPHPIHTKLTLDTDAFPPSALREFSITNVPVDLLNYPAMRTLMPDSIRRQKRSSAIEKTLKSIRGLMYLTLSNLTKSRQRSFEGVSPISHISPYIHTHVRCIQCMQQVTEYYIKGK